MNQGRKDIELVGINDLATTEANRILLKYDSVHGNFPFFRRGAGR
jgi:glyceraldehyde 3-phosphate dehydrogenase